ncbi:HlyD family secretion protein [Cellulophaga baltica]|uniref:HlyD family secretion protein n=1 Tax=Cellulophaga baltica TaxID=76594 RepID=A0A1G7JNK9_9FLAO|nr:HlyD family efflux transporter periplasmic adaptor subunit [Cellulophaga baltica]SDF26384.1 HlyD family secretion protein [Cellulophaga baltica]
MPNKLEDIEFRSEEVQEILSQVPNWMIRRGSVLFFVLILLVLCISWMVKYPDVIENPTLITTQIPPQKEFARMEGKLDSIYVIEAQTVEKNKILAVLENSANTEDVYYLKSILDTLKIKKRIIEFPINEIPILILGEIEIAYAAFENNYSEYQLNKALSPYKNEAIANQVSLNELKVRLQNMQSQYFLSQSELLLKRKNLKRNKSLLDKGVISQLDYENNQLELLSAEKGLKNLGASISQTREGIANADKNSKGTEISRTTEESKLLRNTLQSYNQLKKAISDWENLYVLKSEINGRVSLLNYWNKNQTVNQGDLVFTIIPLNNENYVAKVRAAALNSGKIKIGQKVNIKLQNYPETEFGMLIGHVSNISLTPDKEGLYLVDVSLPEKLITSYHKEIKFQQEMSGTAEIITEDLRLLERFFYQFKSLMDK